MTTAPENPRSSAIEECKSAASVSGPGPCMGRFPALPTVAQSVGADLADDDRGADHPAGVLRCRSRHLAGLRVRHGDAALRRDLPQPVRQALGVGGLDVRLHRPGSRTQSRRALRVDADLVLPLHRRGRHVRFRDVLQPVPERPRRITARVPPIVFFAISAGVVLVRRLTRTSASRRCSPWCSKAASVACILGPGLHRARSSTASASTPPRSRCKGVRSARHEPGRRGLHLLPGRLRERHRPRRRGQEPPAERAQGGDLEPDRHRGLLRLHELRRGLRHPALRHLAG